MKREDMVGVYRQLGEEVVDAAGKVIHSDSNRSSQIMYSADGYVGVVSDAERAEEDPGAGRPHRSRRRDAGGAGRGDALGDLLRRALRAEGDEVHHHVEMALSPNLIGRRDPPRAHRRAEPHAVGAAGRAGPGPAHPVAAGGGEVTSA